MVHQGFVDLQVNGYEGVDFSSPALKLEDVHRVTDALVRAGTIGFCATLITSDLEVYRHNLPVLAEAISEPRIAAHLLGIHMEGPYLSPREGARGAHAPSKMRPPDFDEFCRFQEWAGGNIVLLTLAPELEGALNLIASVSASNRIRIALGHHLAPREILREAAAGGATLITHLGNGCPNTLHRHNNSLIHQLALDSLTAGIITDGHHLPEDFIRVVIRCKGSENVFVVSDSVSIAGSKPGIYHVLGNEVRLTEQGRVESVSSDFLVGSGYNMAQCMHSLRSMNILSEDELWRVGLENPLRILGINEPPQEWSNLPSFVWT